MMTNIPQPKRGFKIKTFGSVQPEHEPIWFECNVPDIIADIQTACESGMGILHPPQGTCKYFILSPSILYDYNEILEYLRSFEENLSGMEPGLGSQDPPGGGER
jgi:hypothetical protein